MAQDLIPAGYESFLRELKERVGQAQVRAAVSVNRKLLALYWEIGKQILEQQRQQGWARR